MTEEGKRLPMSLPVMQQQVAELKMEQHELDQKLAATKKRLATMSKLLVDKMVAEGVTKVRIETSRGAITLFPTTKVYVSKKPELDPSSYIHKLKTIEEFCDLVQEKANSNSVTARVNEFKKGGRDLPIAFQALVNISEDTTLGTRR